MERIIQVGFARQQVPPQEALPLAGYGNAADRLHTAVAQPLCATCVAISDKDNTTILMVSLDLYSLPACISPAAVAEKVGIPADKIFLSATNTHAAPGGEDAAQEYFDRFFQAVVQVCKDALTDQKPADMFTGSVDTEKLNYVKHYKCQDKADGHIFYAGSEYIKPALADYIEHATKADPTLHILKFTREDAPDVVVANFRAQPTFDGGENKTKLSSDYVGAFRTAVEATFGCHVAFFQGACGNIDAQNRMHGGNRYGSATGHGLALAGYAADCLERHMRPAPADKILTKQVTFRGQTIAEGDDGSMVLSAVTIGKDFGFATFPGDMYDSVSVRMEETSTIFATMLLGCCNGNAGYLPSRVAYKYPSVETSLTRFAPGTGEKVADTQAAMLAELKKQY